jgi:hypothetical protein
MNGLIVLITILRGQKRHKTHLSQRPYSVQSDFMSICQDLISDIILSQKCPINMNLILSGQGVMDISCTFSVHMQAGTDVFKQKATH